MVRSRIQIDFRRCRRNSATSRIKMMPRCSSDPACAPERSPQWRGQMPDHVADSGLDLNDRKRPQSAFITNDGIGQDHFHDHPIDWLRALMAAMNVPLSSTEPDLQVPTTVLSSVGEKFAPFARPWIAIGIGASHPDKHWQDAGHPAVAQRGIHGADGIERFLLRRVGRFLYGSRHLVRLGGLGSGPVCRASIVGRDDGQAQILADRRRHRMKGGTVGRSKRCTARAPAAAC
jgi:hypothetical protein